MPLKHRLIVVQWDLASLHVYLKRVMRQGFNLEVRRISFDFSAKYRCNYLCRGGYDFGEACFSSLPVNKITQKVPCHFLFLFLNQVIQVCAQQY